MAKTVAIAGQTKEIKPSGSKVRRSKVLVLGGDAWGDKEAKLNKLPKEAYYTAIDVAEDLSTKDLDALPDIQHLTCLITAVSATKVTVETLIDKRIRITQTRSFDKLPLTGVIECKEGVIFTLTIVTKPGSREFIYTPGNPLDIMYFEETLTDITRLRNVLNDDPTFQKDPETDDGNTF